MIKRFSLCVFSAALILSACAAASFAQTAPVRGRVELEKADGTKVPVAGAIVDVYRVDIKTSSPGDKTDKRGNFNFAGLLLGGKFVISVSAPGCSPGLLPNVTAGDDKLVVTLREGDGKRWTEQEVRDALKGSGQASGSNTGGEKTAEPTEDQKKAQAEYEAKVKAVTANNEKVKNQNTVIQAALTEGNAAFTAKNYDLALSKYEEGIAVDPTFAGTAPVLLNNKGTVLNERAVMKFNANIKETDASAKVKALGSVKADLGDAAMAFSQSLTLLKNAKPGEITNPQGKDAQVLTALKGARATFKLMAQTEQVDETKIDIAKTMLPEYIAAETDAAKKEETKLVLGDLYRVLGDSPNAIAEYRKVLEGSPDNLDAMVGLGLSLVNAGFIANDKAQLQEGANYLQKFAAAAPDSHKFKADALATVEMLKKEQNVTPQKTTSTSKKKGQ